MMQTERVTSMDANFSQTKVVSTQNSLKVYEIIENEQKVIQELTNHSYTQAKFITKDDLIAATTKSGELVIIQNMNKEIASIKITENDSIDCLTIFNPDSPVIILGLSDGTIRLFKFLDNLEEIKKLNIKHNNGVNCLDSNSKFIISGGEDKIVNLIELSKDINHQEISVFKKNFDNEIVDVALCRDDIFDILLFAVCLADDTVHLFSSKIGEPIDHIQKLEVAGAGGCEFTKVGYCLVVASESGIKSFIPNDDGKYVEVETEILK